MSGQNLNSVSSKDQLKRNYDDVYNSESTGVQKLNLTHWPKNRWEALVHCMPNKTKNALEIGCGNGVVLYNIANKAKALTGVEISAKRCDNTKKNLANLDNPTELLQGNIEEGIDKPDGSFDVILWADVIEHVVDVFSVMREVSRLLAPGGTLITSTPNIVYIRYRLAFMFGKFPGTAAAQEGFAVRPNEMYDGGHLHYFTINTLKTLYNMHGIEPTKIMGFGRLGKLHDLWPSLLSGAALVVGRKKDA